VTGRSRTAKEPSYIVPALERGLLLLQAFSKDKPVQSLGVLAKELGLPRATTFRLANTLEHLGFLVRDPETGEYRVGAAALKLGWTYLSGLELPEIAYPLLVNLRYETGASVHMAVREGHDIVYVTRLPARAALSSNIKVGSRLPAHGSSMGRSMLQDLDDDQLVKLYRGTYELTLFSSQTPNTVRELRDLLLKDAQNDGVVISRGFYEKGVVSIAAPIRDGRDRVVAAINITAAAGRYTEEELEGNIRDQVLKAARLISMALGHDPETYHITPCPGHPVPDNPTAESSYLQDDEQGRPQTQDRKGLDKSDRQLRKERRPVVRKEKA